MTFTALSVFAYALDRAFMNAGYPVMDSTKRKLIHSHIWTAATFFLGMPYYFWNKPFTQNWDSYIWQPMVGAANTLGTGAIDLIQHCGRFLGI
jgi:hypothetical protein